MSDAAARELRAEMEIEAPASAVWSVLTDLRRMPEWSPELVRMLPLRRGGLRGGQPSLGATRRKATSCPTRNVVVTVEPDRALAWDTRSSGARWIYELSPSGSGTRVVHRRPVPTRLTVLSKVFAPLFLGGNDGHADELEAGMTETLERLRAAVEG